MSTLFQLQQLLEKRRVQRRIFRNMPSRLTDDQRMDRDWHWLMALVAVVAVCLVAEQVYAHWFVDRVSLRMTQELRK